MDRRGPLSRLPSDYDLQSGVGHVRFDVDVSPTAGTEQFSVIVSAAGQSVESLGCGELSGPSDRCISRPTPSACCSLDTMNFFEGTSGPDQIVVPPGPAACVFGYERRDTLVTLGTEADFVAGGPGPDFVVAFDGGNGVVAGRGADVVVTGDGADVLYGGRGRDAVLSGPAGGVLAWWVGARIAEVGTARSARSLSYEQRR